MALDNIVRSVMRAVQSMIDGSIFKMPTGRECCKKNDQKKNELHATLSYAIYEHLAIADCRI